MDDIQTIKKQGESDCCGAGTYGDNLICSYCGEHCEDVSSPAEAKVIGEIHKKYPKIKHGADSSCPIEFCPMCLKVDTNQDD